MDDGATAIANLATAGKQEVAVAFDAEDAGCYLDEYNQHIVWPKYLKSPWLRFKTGLKQGLGVVLVLIGTASIVFAVGTITQSLAWTFVSFFLGGFLCAGLAFALPPCLHRVRFQRAMQKLNYGLRVDPEGLAVRTDEGSYTYFWKSLENIVVSEHFFIFEVSRPRQGCYPAPLRCFNSREDAEQFLKTATRYWKDAHALQASSGSAP